MRRLFWGLALSLAAPLACTSDISVFGGGLEDDQGGAPATGGSNAEGGAGAAGGADTGGTVTVGPSTKVATATTTVTPTATTTSVTSTSTGNSVSIPCTNETCSGGEICCVHYQSEANDKCAPPGQCGSGYVEVGCNGPMDCAGSEICCGHWNQQSGYQQIDCMPSCNSTASYTAITMCGDDPSVCLSWQDCDPSQFLPTGHSLCQ